MALDFSALIQEGAFEGSSAAQSSQNLAEQLRAAKAELLKEVCQGLDHVAAKARADSAYGAIEFFKPEAIDYHVDSAFDNYVDFSEHKIDPADPLPLEVGTNMRIKMPQGCYPETAGARVEIRSERLALMIYRGQGFRKDGEHLVDIELTDKDILSEPVRHEKIGAFIKGVAKTAAQSGYNFAD